MGPCLVGAFKWCAHGFMRIPHARGPEDLLWAKARFWNRKTSPCSYPNVKGTVRGDNLLKREVVPCGFPSGLIN